MGSGNSKSDNPQTNQAKPLKPCCACPETKKARDAWWVWVQYSHDWAQKYLTQFHQQKYNNGIAWVNGNNIGRYWPVMGPQRRLFVPSTWVRPYPEINQLVILELYKVPSNHLISWEAQPDPIPAPP